MSDQTNSTEPAITDFSSWKGMLLSLVLERAYRHSDEPFKLSSGGLSNDYVDMRRGVAKGDGLRTAAMTLLSFVTSQSINFDAIGGMTMGADPVAHAVALLSGKSWFSVRKAEKTHGARQRLEGAALDSSSRVLLFEDTVSTGRSLIEALDVVVESGATIVYAVTLLDRGDTAAKLLEDRQFHYQPMLTYRDLGIASISPIV